MHVYIFGDVHLRENKDHIDWEYNNRAFLELIRNLDVPKGSVAIQTGDFFDSTKHRGSLNRIALEIVKELNSKFTQVYFITGNHESTLFSGNNLDLLTNEVTVVREICEADIGLDEPILFLPHIPGKTASDVSKLLEEDPKGDYSLILGHHFFKENAPPGSSFLELPTDHTFDYCLMGHAHSSALYPGNRQCIGSIWPCTKGEAENNVGYWIYDGKTLEHKSTKHLFKQFEFLNGGDTFGEDDTKFRVLTVNCKKSQKAELSKLFPQNKFYEIVWEFEEEDKDQTIEVKSDDDLTNLFFKENKVSKTVLGLFRKYNGEGK